MAGNAGAPWDAKYYGEKVPGGIKPSEFDWFHYVILINEICRSGSAGLYWGLAAGISIGLPPVLHFGSEYLKEKMGFDVLMGNKNMCLAITEPWAGSDVANL